MNDGVLAEDYIEAPGLKRQGSRFNSLKVTNGRYVVFFGKLQCQVDQILFDIDTGYAAGLPGERDMNCRCSYRSAKYVCIKLMCTRPYKI